MVGVPKLPEEVKGIDFLSLNDEQLVGFLKNAACISKYGDWATEMWLAEAMHSKGELPSWLTPEDLDVYADAYEGSGLFGGLCHYTLLDLNWELLAGIEEKITVPALYICGDKCSATIWAREAIEKPPKRCADLRDSVILKDCGHWQQVEKPEEVNAELIKFLKDVAK